MEKYSYLLGYVDLNMFLVMLLFAFLGIAVSLLIDSQKRDPSSKNTPEKFSLKFLLKDNWRTIALTALIVILTLRFATSFFPGQFAGDDTATPEGLEKWFFGALVVGLGFNQLLQLWKKTRVGSFLKVKRENGK
ncbi:MAG: hypothetical protein A2Y71_03755 [Bacteroidetes bacterium RBG_13_42_15]|nr:MAG: hypothetical protein A2Y71_03755 [Bacteroidetes bacterium RBG_13_42_15]